MDFLMKRRKLKISYRLFLKYNYAASVLPHYTASSNSIFLICKLWVYVEHYNNNECKPAEKDIIWIQNLANIRIKNI